MKAIEEGQLRRDIYYRLSMMSITIPPLRERKKDIAHFVKFYVNKHNVTFNKNVQYVSKELLARLEEYDWPGNVREIRNFVERMVVMTPRAAREINVIPPGMLSSVPKPDSAASCDLPSPHCSRRGQSRDQILRALSECSGHREKAAEYLGISRRTLQYKIKEYHISPRCRYQTAD